MTSTWKGVSLTNVLITFHLLMTQTAAQEVTGKCFSVWCLTNLSTGSKSRSCFLRWPSHHQNRVLAVSHWRKRPDPLRLSRSRDLPVDNLSLLHQSSPSSITTSPVEPEANLCFLLNRSIACSLSESIGCLKLATILNNAISLAVILCPNSTISKVTITGDFRTECLSTQTVTSGLQ